MGKKAPQLAMLYCEGGEGRGGYNLWNVQVNNNALVVHEWYDPPFPAPAQSNQFILRYGLHTSVGARPPPQHLAAVDSLLLFCARRCNAKRPNTAPHEHPEQPASLNELWETDLFTADTDASSSGSEEEASAAAGGGYQQHGDGGGDFAWGDGPFVSEEANDAPYWFSVSDQFRSWNSSSPRTRASCAGGGGQMMPLQRQ